MKVIESQFNPIPSNPKGIKFLCRDGSVERLEKYQSGGDIYIGVNFGFAYFDNRRSPIIGNYVFSEREPNDKDIIGVVN